MHVSCITLQATVLTEAEGYRTSVVVGTPNYMCPDVLQASTMNI